MIDIGQQPVPTANIFELQGRYAGEAVVGEVSASHWQMDMTGNDKSMTMSVNSDLYFATETISTPSLPIRQVSEYYVNGDYLGLMIMDVTSSSTDKPNPAV